MLEEPTRREAEERAPHDNLEEKDDRWVTVFGAFAAF